MFELTLTKKFLPMTIGSSSRWLMFAGIIALSDATSPRTNSGVTESPPRDSRLAANLISSVTMPFLASESCVAEPSAGPSAIEVTDGLCPVLSVSS